MTIRRNTYRILLYTTLFFSIVFMTGCPTFNPSRTYDADLMNYEPSSGMTTAHLTGHTATIQANAPWQPSGVQVVSGDTVKILALSKWSQAPGFNVWSGPEGLNGTGKEVPWINANALMGKIGDKGKPFEVGSELELRAKGDGEIYLAINDPFPWIQDNSGSMQVTIYTGQPSASFANLQLFPHLHHEPQTLPPNCHSQFQRKWENVPHW